MSSTDQFDADTQAYQNLEREMAAPTDDLTALMGGAEPQGPIDRQEFDQGERELNQRHARAMRGAQQPRRQEPAYEQRPSDTYNSF